jgi:galactonate dehydratase
VIRVTNVRAHHVPKGGVRPVLVDVQTDVGITGRGEAAVAQGLGGRAAVGVVSDVVHRVIGATLATPTIIGTTSPSAPRVAAR